MTMFASGDLIFGGWGLGQPKRKETLCVPSALSYCFWLSSPLGVGSPSSRAGEVHLSSSMQKL